MAIVKTVVCILSLLCLTYSIERGGAKFDYGTATVQQSPFSMPILWRTIPQFTIEGSVTNYFSFSPMSGSERFVDTDWGVLGGTGIHRWSGTFSYLEAFSIYQEFHPSLSYAITPVNWFTLGARSSLSVLRVPNDSDTELGFAIGCSFNWKLLTVGTQWAVQHVSSDQLRSIPQGELALLATLEESKFGSQAIKFVWNHTDHTGYLAIVESFSITSWWGVAFSMQSEPFKVGLSTSFTIGSTTGSAHFSRHSDLGWSSTGTVQYRRKQTSSEYFSQPRNIIPIYSFITGRNYLFYDI